jgi:divalent metal cation (Fe/Co/Zn/Cd) transporter
MRSAPWPLPARWATRATASRPRSARARATASRARRSSPTATTLAPTPYVSLAVVASAAVVALGLDVADPLIGLGITVVILRITWRSWRTVSGHGH